MTDTAGTWTVGRPAVRGRVEWTLVAAADEVRSAVTLPRRVHEELTGVLDSPCGDRAGEVANRTADLVRALVFAGAAGALRLTGYPRQILVELVGSRPPRTEASSTALFELAGSGVSHGHYQTLGETSSQHVAWGLLTLPGRPGDDTRVVDPDADDVWS